MKDKPNWKKGDIVVLLGHDGGALSVFEAEHDPVYCSTLFSSEKDWYYGLRLCEQIRLATKNDIDQKIKIQQENVRRQQLYLDELLNFREMLGKSAKVRS